jgi:gas vesicle protein
MGKRTGPVKEPGPSTGRSGRARAAAPGAEAVPKAGEDLRPAATETVNARAAERPSEIRQNIEQTRSELDGTIGELQERLSPSHVKEQVRESVKETIEETRTALRAATVGKVETMIRDTGDTLNEARQSIWSTIRENPVPAAISAIGLTWLFMNRGGSSGGRRYASRSRHTGAFETDDYGRGYGESDRGLGSRAGSAVRQARERASDVVESAQEKAGELASTASDTAERIADQAQVQVRRVEQAVGRWMDDNPLALGAVALAAGTAIGLALPRTEKEDRLLGSARDTVVDRAQELATEAVDTVRDRLSDVQQDQQQHTH